LLSPSSVPAVSIGLPVYNGERFLRQALDSLLAQTFGDFELIISDNASSDSTAAICAEYCVRDERITYYRQPRNIGLFANVHYVMQQARGRYFMVAGDDDVYEPRYLKTLTDLLSQYPAAVLAYTNFGYIAEDGEKRAAPTNAVAREAKDSRFANLMYFIVRRSCLPMMIGLFRTAALRKALPMPYRELFPMTGDVDNVFLVRVLASGRVVGCAEALFRYRLKNRSASSPADWPSGTFKQQIYLVRHNARVALLMQRAIRHAAFSPVQKMILLLWNWFVFGGLMSAGLLARTWRLCQRNKAHTDEQRSAG
jgi:glycosyltransferase involved in cell wall biosynthesis